MHKQKVRNFILNFLLCVLGFSAYSQITTNTTQGCAPLNVVFNPPAGASSPHWDFGPGQGTSLNSGQVTNIYTSAGNYLVTYTAVIGGSPVTYTVQITVYAPPTVNFSITQPSSHCAPMSVTLTPSGAPAGSTYSWVFGDGSGGPGNPATHSYGTAGNYVPGLTVLTANGCSATASPSGTISVSSLPSIAISANPGLSACTAPFNTSFSSNVTSGSPLTGNLIYNWTFGNSTPPSTQANPGSVTYGQGQFVVSLTATDDNSCSNTFTTQVSVTQPSISATIPATVCYGAPFFVTVQSTQLMSYWTMGDGGSATFTVPTANAPFTNTVYIYNTPGPQTIFISVNSGTCVATQTLSTFVEQIVPSFTTLPPYVSCGPSVTVNYINQSTVNSNAGLTYSWSAMGPPTPPAADNHATYTFTTGLNSQFTFYQNSLNPYTAYANFIPAISLTVQSLSAAHCTANIVQSLDTLIRPTAFFNKDKSGGCAPLTVNFRDTSFTNLLHFPITAYSWNNGANPPTIVSGTLVPPATITAQSFTYNTAGTYTPYLIIYTQGGCADTSFIDTITVVNPSTLTASFASSVCAGSAIPIHLLASPSQTAIDHWHATTDDGYFSGCVNDSVPSFMFTHVGTHTVGLTAYQNGCVSNTVAAQQITVHGPYGRFRFYTDCSTPTVVTFSSFLQEVQTATLNFGDGSPPLIITGNATGTATNTVAHSYTVPATGGLNYVATLTSANPTNTSCATNVYTMQVKVRTPKAVIYVNGGPPTTLMLNPLACTNANVVFDAYNSIDAASSCMRGFQWSLISPAGPQPPSESSQSGLNSSFNAPGMYTLTLKISDENECSDTASVAFRVSSAPPAFHFSVNPICLSDNPVRIVNTATTTTLNPDPYTGFTWNFGDGSPVLSTSSASAIPSHSYSNVPPPSRNFTVTATATNSFGCTNTAKQVITIKNPSALFFASAPLACIPQTVSFTAPPPTYSLYSFSFGDVPGTFTTTSSSIVHNFTASGNYSVGLTVTDSAGCKNTSTINSFSAFVTPVASFTTLGNANFCTPATITFTNTSTSSDPVHSPITSFYWDLGTGPIPVSTPSAVSIFSTGVTAISLTVSPSFPFCSAVATETIYVYDTHATLQLNKTKFCIGDAIEAHLTGLNDANDWICNVGFGVEPSTTPVPVGQDQSYTYTNTLQTGTAIVVAQVNSLHDACAISTNSFLIEIVKLDPDFKRNLEQSVVDSMHCLRIQDAFTPTVNTTLDGLSYTWDFGNGSTTTSPNPMYTYTAAGVYPVHMTIKDNVVGCAASSIKNMTIIALPTASIYAGNNCPDKTFTISGAASQGVISGTWAPTENIVGPAVIGITNPTFAASGTATAPLVYSLSVTDGNGCVSDVVTSSLSIQKIAQPMNKDTAVVIGQSVAINMFEEGGFTYSWTPVINDLSCTNCFNPTSTTTVDITYTVQVADTLGCAEVQSTYKIIIEPKTSVDVPSAFTPNGDGKNDVVYADGWGIKKLNYFRIYNRWGQLLFESNDIKIGWDGNYNGVPQNMETYVYQVSVETYLDDKPILKTGTVKIIR